MLDLFWNWLKETILMLALSLRDNPNVSPQHSYTWEKKENKYSNEHTACLQPWIGVLPYLGELEPAGCSLWKYLQAFWSDWCYIYWLNRFTLFLLQWAELKIRRYYETKKYQYFSYFSIKMYVVGTQQKHLSETLLMSTHNICFCGEIRKNMWIPQFIWSYALLCSFFIECAFEKSIYILSISFCCNWI